MVPVPMPSLCQYPWVPPPRDWAWHSSHPLPGECIMLGKAVNPTPADRAGHGAGLQCWACSLIKVPLFQATQWSEWGERGHRWRNHFSQRLATRLVGGIGGGGAHLSSQHWGGRGRASLDYIESSKTVRARERQPCLKKENKNPWGLELT